MRVTARVHALRMVAMYLNKLLSAANIRREYTAARVDAHHGTVMEKNYSMDFAPHALPHILFYMAHSPHASDLGCAFSAWMLCTKILLQCADDIKQACSSAGRRHGYEKIFSLASSPPHAPN